MAMVRTASSGMLTGVATAVVAVILGAGAAHAGSIDAQYAVSLAGLSMGTATLTGTVSATKYSLSAQAHLSGLAGMVTGGKGAASATGNLAGGRIVPGNYALTASNSEMTRTVQMGMTGAGVQQVLVNPPLDPKPDRVPVTGEHQRGIVDPLAAILMQASSGSPEAACNRRIPVFDGAQRFDIQLTYSGTRNATTQDGYSGPVIVCKARYMPIAGHRSERAAVKYMANNHDMETWLAPSGVEGVYLPFRVSVKTMIGTTVLQAVKWRIEQSETTAAIRR